MTDLEHDPDAERVRLTPEEAIKAAFNILVEKKARDVLWLDISSCSDLADAMLIATAGSGRQAQALANELTMSLKRSGVPRLSLSGVESGQWVAADYGDFIVHIMRKDTRSYYDLEALWADAKIVASEAGQTVAEDDEDADFAPLGAFDDLEGGFDDEDGDFEDAENETSPRADDGKREDDGET